MEPIKVSNLDILKALPNHQQGEIAFVEDQNSTYIYMNDEQGWVPFKAKTNTDGLQMNLYELNKSIVSQLPVFDNNAWNGAEKIVNDWISSQLNQEKKPRYLCYMEKILVILLYLEEYLRAPIMKTFSRD